MTGFLGTIPAILAQHGGTLMLPRQSSTVAPAVDGVFNFILWTSIFFFVLIVGLMCWFVAAYRRTPTRMKATSHVTHNTPLELAWSILPSFLLVVMFWLGFKIFMDMRVMPEDAYEIQVGAQQWNWSFKYPNGHEDADLHIPAGRNVRLIMNSVDVLHSLFIPDFRVKMDVVPGRYTKMWFRCDTPTEPGKEHLLFCTEYCGKDHSNMNARVFVHPADNFETWLKNADPLSRIPEEDLDAFFRDADAYIKAHPEIEKLLPPAELGKSLYRRKGCASCHSIDGTPNTGPTFLGAWGRTEKVMAGGASLDVVVDEDYVRESILNPGAKVVAGYQNVMTPYQGRIKEREIRALIEYLKTLKQ